MQKDRQQATEFNRKVGKIKLLMTAGIVALLGLIGASTYVNAPYEVNAQTAATTLCGKGEQLDAVGISARSTNDFLALCSNGGARKAYRHSLNFKHQLVVKDQTKFAGGLIANRDLAAGSGIDIKGLWPIDINKAQLNGHYILSSRP